MKDTILFILIQHRILQKGIFSGCEESCMEPLERENPGLLE
jgi:hypothetical protein